MKELEELEFSVHVVKSLYENYLEYKTTGENEKANSMLLKLIENGNDIVKFSNELVKIKE